ncbi:PQQ-binding-like beta-propeller repeat protein [Myxococcaceae bacterium GXIMD 01537]
MTRFRLGHRWKREPTPTPVDSVALDIDGVNLLPGAEEEALGEVVPALVSAVAALHTGSRRLAQVSLAEAHLELVLRRTGTQVELLVASLARPARLLRPAIRVEEEELAQAARRCGEGFLSDVSRLAPRALGASGARELGEALRQLSRAASDAEEARPQPFTRRVEPPEVPGFGFELKDPGGLLRSYARKKGSALGSLLCAGEVWLALPGQAAAWRAEGPPLLTALELSRQAGELARAVELEEPRFSFAPAGLRQELTLDLPAKRARLGRAAFDVEPRALVEAMFHLGQALAVTITEQDRSQASNPYLMDLAERCREGLSHLRGPVQPPESKGAARERAPGSRGASKPLKVPGRLRRLRFEKLWEQRGLPGAEYGQLLLGRRGPVFSSREVACAFAAKDGAVLWRREADHGVAASADGHAVTADASRVCGFVGTGAGARWLHDHDGIPLGPLLLRRDGQLITLSNDRTVVSFAEVTGRELWRLAPPRTQRSWLSTQAHRALLATDSGYLYGLDLTDGQVRYRIRSPLPFLGAPQPWGRRFVAMLGRGTHHAVLVADAHTGEAAWTHEFQLASPSAPLAVGKHLFLAGAREREGVLVDLDARGKPRWERALHLGAGPYALASLESAVLVTSASGALERVSATGHVDWRVGASGEPLVAALPARTARGVVFVPGETVRAVDPRGGQVLAEVQAGAGLVALQADARLNLFFLDETGVLSAYRLVSHFTVVGD